MRELLTCDEHGVRWAQGDAPCQKCKARDEKRNAEVERLRIPRTKSGKVWPVKGDKDYA